MVEHGPEKAGVPSSNLGLGTIVVLPPSPSHGTFAAFTPQTGRAHGGQSRQNAQSKWLSVHRSHSLVVDNSVENSPNNAPIPPFLVDKSSQRSRRFRGRPRPWPFRPRLPSLSTSFPRQKRSFGRLLHRVLHRPIRSRRPDALRPRDEAERPTDAGPLSTQEDGPSSDARQLACRSAFPTGTFFYPSSAPS